MGPLFVDPLQEDVNVRLKVGLLDKVGPQALYVFNTEGHRYFMAIEEHYHGLLCLADHKLKEVEGRSDGSAVRVSP